MSNVDFQTDPLPVAERMHEWERCNRENWIDVRCAVAPESGFWATFRSRDFGDIKVSEMGMAPHAVRRDGSCAPSNIAGDSIVVSLFVEGNGYFHSSDGLITYRPGDALIYRSNSAFVFGMVTQMRQMVIQLPGDSFSTTDLPIQIAPSRSRSTVPSGHLRDAAAQLMTASPVNAPIRRSELIEHAQNLLLSGSSPSYQVYIDACRFIERNIRDRQLTPDAVAEEMGFSTRHLNRMFRANGSSLAASIRRERLARARADLVGLDAENVTVAHVAAMWGFANAATFSKAFSRQFGHPPSALFHDSHDG